MVYKDLNLRRDEGALSQDREADGARSILARLHDQSGTSWRVFTTGLGEKQHQNIMRWIRRRRTAVPRDALRAAASGLPITRVERDLLMRVAGAPAASDPEADSAGSDADASPIAWAREARRAFLDETRLGGASAAIAALDGVQDLINLCDYPRASRELRRIAADHPDALKDDPDVRAVWLTRRAWTSYYLGFLRAAIADLQAVVRIAELTGGPMAIHAHHFLGRAYRDLATTCRAGSARLRALADRSFALSTAGLARIGSQEQAGYAHLREAQLARAFRDRDRYRREMTASREHLSGTDASWHQSLEEAEDVELHANARRFRADTAMFGAWRFGYRRGIASAHDVLADLVAARSDQASMALASDHLAASLAALPELGAGRIDDRRERLMAFLDTIDAPVRGTWVAEVRGRLAHHDGVFASLSAIDAEDLGAQRTSSFADSPGPATGFGPVGCPGRTSDCRTCGLPEPIRSA